MGSDDTEGLEPLSSEARVTTQAVVLYLTLHVVFIGTKC